MFGATNIVKHIDKSMYVYRGHGIAFDGAGLGNFGNNFARDVVLFH